MDHSAWFYLVRQQNLPGRLAQCVLLLQEFDYEVIYGLGAQHFVVDYLSCLDFEEPLVGADDEFLDASLFAVLIPL